jgi:hypothetical protein
MLELEFGFSSFGVVAKTKGTLIWLCVLLEDSREVLIFLLVLIVFAQRWRWEDGSFEEPEFAVT